MYIWATFLSLSVRGSIYSSFSQPSISGNAFLSSFPLLVTGILSICIIYCGTIYPGNTFFSFPLSLDISMSSSDTRYAFIPFSPFLSSFTITTTSFTSALSLILLSISPSSIRNPLIFTWSSILPKYSMFPSGNHLARSPVLYILPSPYGFLTNFSSVRSFLLRYPLASPSPIMQSSPGTPIPHCVSPFIMYIFVLLIGFPIGIFPTSQLFTF